jgi:hypothetical protein
VRLFPVPNSSWRRGRSNRQGWPRTERSTALLPWT